MSLPRRPGRKRYCGVRLEPPEWRWLVEEAHRLGTSVSHVVRLAVRAYQRMRTTAQAPEAGQGRLPPGLDAGLPPEERDPAGLAPEQFLRFFGWEATEEPAAADAGERRDEPTGSPRSEA